MAHLSYLIARPPMPDDPAARATFDALFDRAVRAGAGRPLDYELPYPRWQFLCHIAETRDVVLHGSGDPGIARFEPSHSDDNNEFVNRKAVYAASDGLWPMYFAILDRANHRMSLINAAVRIEGEDGALSEPLYFFSITREALAKRPFRPGTIYVLPRANFEKQEAMQSDGKRIWPEQWASLEPVAPLFKIAVGPEDFPLLGHIRGHDHESTFARARANPEGFPWLADD